MLLGNAIFLPHSAHLIAFSNILTKAGLEKSPVLCPNNKYRMIYLNMGHGDDCFSDAAQKLLFTNAFRWVVSKSPKGNPFEK